MRLIDADALLDAMRDEEFQTFVPLDEIDSVIDKAPTIDAVPVVHARWKMVKNSTSCSACDEFLPSITYVQGGYNGHWQCCEEIEKTRYCPNCGAKMDGGSEE